VVHAWGLNLVVLTLRVRAPWGGEPLGLPINLRVHRKEGPSLLELAQEMMQEVAGWFPEREFALRADGFYASLAGAGLPRTELTSRLRRDAALYELPPARRKQRGRPRLKGARLPTPEGMAARAKQWQRVKTEERGQERERLIHTRVVLWYEVCKTRPVRLVISRDPEGKEKDEFLVTTALDEAPAQTVGGFAGRWCIEDTNRSVKQELGAEELQTWSGAGPERAAALGFLLYGLVWAWYLADARRRQRFDVPDWYLHKSHPSFRDALRALRGALWQERIYGLSKTPSLPRKIVSLLIAALAEAA